MFKIFDFSAERQLASRLVDELVKELPAGLIENKRKILSVNKITRLLERTYAGAIAYQTSSNPGFIKRAVLANNFKWQLKSKNYPDDFIEMATEGMVVEMAKARTASPTS